MLELAETVKEVSLATRKFWFFNFQLQLFPNDKRLIVNVKLCSSSILLWRSWWWRTHPTILAKGSPTSQKQRSCSNGSRRSSWGMDFLSWRMISEPDSKSRGKTKLVILGIIMAKMELQMNGGSLRGDCWFRWWLDVLCSFHYLSCLYLE